MIKAKKKKSFELAFDSYLKPLLRSSFSNLFGRGIEAPSEKPVIFIANHSSWWDGLIFFYLNKQSWKHDIHMMMHESGLTRYPYFRFLGAFSINRKKPKDIMASLEYTEQLLKDGKSVVLFPQGDEFHQESRPLTFHNGVIYLLERCPDIPIIPISLYYSFRHERKPEVWIDQKKDFYYRDIPGGKRKEKTAFLETFCTEHLDELKGFVVAEQTDAFQELRKRRKS